MDTVNPWGGYMEGQKSLQSALSNVDTMESNRQLRELQMLKLAEAKQAAEDRQAIRALEKTLSMAKKPVTTQGYGGLADVQAYENAVRQNRQGAPAMWSDTATAPVPAGGQGINLPTMGGQPAASTPMGLGLSNAPNGPYETFNRNMAEKPFSQEQLDALNEKAIAAQQASGLKTYAPQTEQVALSPMEKAQQRANLLASQGQYKEAESALKAGGDITRFIPEETQRQQRLILGFVQPRLALGGDPDQVKMQAVEMARQMGLPPNQIQTLQNTEFTKNGVMISTLPDGSKILSALQSDGTVKTEYHKNEKQTDPFAGGFDVLDVKARAAALRKAKPTMTQDEALVLATQAVRADINAAKRQNMQFKFDLGGGADRKSIQGETGLRKEFNALPEVKNYKTFSSQFATMSSVMNKMKDFKSLNPADQVLIMDFNKALDPSSVVRESEYARTPENMSILNRASAATSRLMQGGVLSTAERQALMQAATIMKNASKSQYNAVRAQYQDLAKQYGYDPKNVVPTLTQTGDAPPTGKTVVRTGTTKDGRKVIQYSDGSIVTQ